MPSSLAQKNRRLLVTVLGVVAVMVALSFAAVPLYRAFCQLTGFGGTTMLAERAPDEKDILNRTVTIALNTDTGRHLLWDFKAERRRIDLRLGQQGLVSFAVKNNDRVPVSAVAVYNVTPQKAGKYFRKTACFCFGEQTLNPGEKASYPVVFFIDPAMDKDPNMADVTRITLSYTFFAAGSAELDDAMENFTQGDAPDPAVSGTVALPPEKQ